MSHTFKIQPIILCGGSGTRLWPFSTPKIPKQFISLGERGTLLEETMRRVALVMNKCVGYETCDPLLIMHHTHRLPSELSIYESNVVYEEYANDTAVAVAKSVLEIRKRHDKLDDVIILVLPADHYIYNVDAFVNDITNGITHVTENNIVLYGIDPTGPETKYGYIIPSDSRVTFREKPDVTLALDLISQNALWNSGIFAANANLVLKSLDKSRYNIMDWIHNPRDGKAQSFDVAILQEHNNIYAHHCDGWRWSDVGTWESFMEIPEIKNEMVDYQVSTVTECTNVNILNRSTNNIVLIGCENLNVVANGQDILIMSNRDDYNNQLKEVATRICTCNKS
jgi:mannose-1-phosphate guanylyltransferase